MNQFVLVGDAIDGVATPVADRRLLARAGALLFAVAGAIGLFALLLTGGSGDSLASAVGTSVASWRWGLLFGSGASASRTSSTRD